MNNNVGFLLSVLIGCGAPLKASKPKEAADFSNTIDTFNIDKVYTYADLQKNLSVAAPKIPWTDTYWPSVNQGLSWRWQSHAPTTEDQGRPEEEVKLGKFLREFAREAIKPRPAVWLSAAEKYDLLFQYRYQLGTPAQEINALAEEVSKVDGQIRVAKRLSQKRELLSSMSSAIATNTMWNSMPMSSSGWSTFLDYSRSPSQRYLGQENATGEDWSWVGLCHGWAPAAGLTKAPRHSVLAIIGAKEVLFTEGDIRGLVTKAWADHPPVGKGAYFMGRRCEQSLKDPETPIRSNAKGKGISGFIDDGSGRVRFIMIETLPILLDSNAIVYRIKLQPIGTEKLLIEQGNTYHLANKAVDLIKAQGGNFDALQAVSASFNGCWDTNPASFHEVLIEQLAVRKTGLVMDRTRTAQVWNQPIYGADFRLGPLQAVENVRDVAEEYRASGTRYLAQVDVDVAWSTEPAEPLTSYRGIDASQIVATNYQYTLEFDASKRVIGGEWGTFKSLMPEQSSPDFLFGYAAGSEPLDDIDSGSRIDYQGIIKKLHTCSLDDRLDGQLPVANGVVAYSKCAIERD